MLNKTLIFLFLTFLSLRTIAQSNSIGVDFSIGGHTKPVDHDNNGWIKILAELNYKRKVKRSEFNLGLGCGFSYLTKQKDSNPLFPGIGVDLVNRKDYYDVYNYYLNRCVLKDIPVHFKFSHRLYLSKKIGKEYAKLQGAFWGNSISFFTVTEYYNLDFLHYNNIFLNQNNSNLEISGKQHFDVFRFATESGYRFIVNQKYYIEPMVSVMIYKTLLENSDTNSPWNSSRIELNIGIGYFF